MYYTIGIITIAFAYLQVQYTTVIIFIYVFGGCAYFFLCGVFNSSRSWKRDAVGFVTPGAKIIPPPNTRG